MQKYLNECIFAFSFLFPKNTLQFLNFEHKASVKVLNCQPCDLPEGVITQHTLLTLETHLSDISILCSLFYRLLRLWSMWQKVQILQLLSDACPSSHRCRPIPDLLNLNRIVGSLNHELQMKLIQLSFDRALGNNTKMIKRRLSITWSWLVAYYFF